MCENKGKGGRHATLTSDQISKLQIVGMSNVPKDVLNGGLSYDCQLGPQQHAAQIKKYAINREKRQNVIVYYSKITF